MHNIQIPTHRGRNLRNFEQLLTLRNYVVPCHRTWGHLSKRGFIISVTIASNIFLVVCLFVSFCFTNNFPCHDIISTNDFFYNCFLYFTICSMQSAFIASKHSFHLQDKAPQVFSLRALTSYIITAGICKLPKLL